ncbi:very long chain fatty acid elongase 2-like isoform X2 [Babylonia areolata]|uniref:very long chain fatty acid elongase 2-like isoform X2 n=1 Tax=Babylonia areolata TaxID=304850 RepID=UPI003FD0801A
MVTWVVTLYRQSQGCSSRAERSSIHKMEIYNQVRVWYDDYVLSQTDVRSRSWFLMGSPAIPFIAVASYLGAVYYGPKVMRDRPAWDLKGILVPYNFALVALSAYMCCEFLFAAVEERYSLLCQDIDFSLRPNALRMLNVCWWYYFSKYIELTDTVCFILRKKNGQITFLHVYHHATMIPFWWMSVAYIPGGQNSVLADRPAHQLQPVPSARLPFPKGLGSPGSGLCRHPHRALCQLLPSGLRPQDSPSHRT